MRKQIVTHYDFHAYTDVDRYKINNEYRQVLIAAREVAPEDYITRMGAAETRIYTRIRGLYVAGERFCSGRIPGFLGQ